jgi:beta-galactosidase GanA
VIDSLPLERAISARMPYHTSAHLRHGENGSYLFVENYSGTKQTVDLGGEFTDMISGEKCSRASLAEFDAKIYKK